MGRGLISIKNEPHVLTTIGELSEQRLFAIIQGFDGYLRGVDVGGGYC